MLYNMNHGKLKIVTQEMESLNITKLAVSKRVDCSASFLTLKNENLRRNDVAFEVMEDISHAGRGNNEHLSK